MKRAVLVVTAFLSGGYAAPAQVPADQMSCEQAVAYYERHNQIFVLTNGRFLLPVRAGVPLARRNELSCKSERGLIPRPYYVRTRDVGRCAVAVTC